MRSNYNGSNQNGTGVNGSGSDWFIQNTEVSERNNVKKEVNTDRVNTDVREDKVDIKNVLMHDKLIETYEELESEMLIKEQSEINKQEEIAEKHNYKEQSPYSNGNEDDFKPEEKPKKKLGKGAIVGIIVGSVAVIAAIVVAVILLMGNISGFNDNTESTISQGVVDELQSEINLLYVDNLKTDIKDGYSVSDLDKFRKEVKEYSGYKDCSDIINELNTIEAYLGDKKKIDTYSDLSYNIEPDYVGNDCTSIKSGAETYTVAGLKSTIVNKASDVINDRNNYLTIKKELSGITDVLSFSEKNYTNRISGIKHTENKKELQSMYDKLVSDKEIALAEKSLKDAKDEEAKKKAEDELKEAKEKNEQASKELENMKKALEEALKSQTEPVTTVSGEVEETTSEVVTENIEEGNE